MTEDQIKKSAINHFNQGRTKYNLGQYAAGILDFNFAIALKPDFAEALSSRGIAKVKLKQYNAAITDYNSAIKFDPTDALNYYNRAEAIRLSELYKVAIWDYDKTSLHLLITIADWQRNSSVNLGKRNKIGKPH